MVFRPKILGLQYILLLLRFFTFFYVFLKIKKKRDFLRFFALLHTFSRTMHRPSFKATEQSLKSHLSFVVTLSIFDWHMAFRVSKLLSMQIFVYSTFEFYDRDYPKKSSAVRKVFFISNLFYFFLYQ